MRVALKDIYKSFGEVEVVKGLNLEIAEGEFLVLLGPSGCGKTTALRMIAGLEAVSRGRILIGERDVTEVLPLGIGTMVLNLAYIADDAGKPVPWNETRWSDPEFSKLLQEANGLLNVDERRKVMSEIGRCGFGGRHPGRG